MAKSNNPSTKPYLFNIRDVRGKTVSLQNPNTRYILIAFLRYAGCPYCNLAIHRLSIEYPLLIKNDCEVIAFVQSNEENITKNIYERHAHKPEFSIVADPESKIYRKYGVKSSMSITAPLITRIPYWVKAVTKHGFWQKNIDGSFFLVPAWFLINTETNTIVKQQEGVSFYNHETFIDIYDSLIFKD